MRAIYEFFWDCGRAGELNGLFTADTGDVAKAVGRDVHFGEVLGKHSEVFGTLEGGDCVVISEDQEFIEKFEGIMGTGTISGFNPLDYINEEG